MAEETTQTKFAGMTERLSPPRFETINPNELEHGPHYPNQSLLDQIDAFGIAQAVTLFERPGVADNDADRFAIAGGRRIVLAAQQLGITEIPAIIYPADDWDLYESVSLALNANRTADPFAELGLIQGMMEDGFDTAAIGKKTRFGAPLVNKRLLLSTLHDDLALGVRRNRIALPVAEKAASLPENAQERLVAIFHEKDALAMKDVRELMDELDGGEHTKQVSFLASDDWRKDIRKAVAKAQDQGVALEALIEALTAEFGEGDDE